MWRPTRAGLLLTRERAASHTYVSSMSLPARTGRNCPICSKPAKAVDQIIHRALRKHLQKLGARQDANLNMVMSQRKVRRWLDNNTFKAYAGESRRVMVHENDEEWEYLGCAVLFRGKCDNRGRWKVTLSRQSSDAEDEKTSQEGDHSRRARRLDEGLVPSSRTNHRRRESLRGAASCG